MHFPLSPTQLLSYIKSYGNIPGTGGISDGCKDGLQLQCLLCLPKSALCAFSAILFTTSSVKLGLPPANTGPSWAHVRLLWWKFGELSPCPVRTIIVLFALHTIAEGCHPVPWVGKYKDVIHYRCNCWVAEALSACWHPPVDKGEGQRKLKALLLERQWILVTKGSGKPFAGSEDWFSSLLSSLEPDLLPGVISSYVSSAVGLGSQDAQPSYP